MYDIHSNKTHSRLFLFKYVKICAMKYLFDYKIKIFFLFHENALKSCAVKYYT